jgi:hypothetical protein
MSRGYYKRRRGILEHLENGTIGLLDLAVHDYLSLKANLLIGSDCSIPPGVCFTSAVAIHALCPREISERAVRRSLAHLVKIGWIKRWHIRGKSGNYPILVCRASVHDVSGVEYRVNGLETVDWRRPVLVLAALCPQSSSGLSGYREERVENRETNRLGGGLELDTKEAAFEAFWDKWPKKQAKSRAWTAWKKISLAEHLPLLAGLEKWLKSDQWTRGVIPHAASWLNEKRWQDEDIPCSGRANGLASVVPLDELRQKRSTMTDEGRSLLEKAGGLIQ